MLFCSPKVGLNSRHFAAVVTAFKSSICAEVRSYRLELTVQYECSLCCCVRALGSNESELGLEHDLSSQVRATVIHTTRLLYLTGGHWRCAHHKSNSVKATDGADVTKTGVRQKQSVVEADWNETICVVGVIW